MVCCPIEAWPGAALRARAGQSVTSPLYVNARHATIACTLRRPAHCRTRNLHLTWQAPLPSPLAARRALPLTQLLGLCYSAEMRGKCRIGC